jgi:hypothetical protein
MIHWYWLIVAFLAGFPATFIFLCLPGWLDEWDERKKQKPAKYPYWTIRSFYREKKD